MSFLLVCVVILTLFSVGVAFFSSRQPLPPSDLSDARIRAEAQKGNTVVAMRWYRTLHRVGVKRAKEAVEKLAKEP